MAAYQVGDQVRVMQVPPSLYTVINRDTGQIFEETVQVFEACVGQAFRVEDFDEYGSLELRVTDEGKQATKVLCHHIWIEPDYVQPAEIAVPKGDPVFEAQARRMVRQAEARGGGDEERGGRTGVPSPVKPSLPSREGSNARPLPEASEADAQRPCWKCGQAGKKRPRRERRG